MAAVDPSTSRSQVAPYAANYLGTSSIYLATPLPTTLSTISSAPTLIQINATSSTNLYGTQRQFNFQQNLPEGIMCTLECTVSPITVTGGTYLEIIDFFGIFAFQQIVWKDNTQGQIEAYIPELAYAELLVEPSYTLQQQKLSQCLGNLSSAVRSTLAATGFVMEVECWSWWDERPENTFRIQQIDTPISATVYLRPLTELIRTDGTNPTGTMDIIMNVYGRIPTAAERNTTYSVIGSPEGQLLQLRDGIYYEIGTIPSGTVGMKSFKIDQFKGPIYELDLFFRAQSEVHGSYTSPFTNNFTNFDNSFKPTSFEIKTGNENIIQLVPTSRMLKENRLFKFPSSLPEENLVKVNICEKPEKYKTLNSGYVDWSYVGTPVINLYYTTPTTTDISFGILARTNILAQHQAGSFKAITSN